MDHDLNEFVDPSPTNTGSAEGGGYQMQDCGICGNEYPRVRDHCPNCGHGTNNGGDHDQPTENERPDSRFAPNVTVSNPSSWGIGFLVDAPTDDLAVRFAVVAIDRLKTVNQVSDEKYGIDTPNVTLLDDSSTSIIKPWGDISSVPEAIPVDGAEGSTALNDLIGETDWNSREPTPHLYTEYGEPLVDKDEFGEYMDSHEPEWVVPAIATEQTSSDRNRVIKKVQECGYCNDETVQKFVGRDGIPSGFTIAIDLATPIWECQTCGNYHHGGPLAPDTTDEERDQFDEAPPSESTAP